MNNIIFLINYIKTKDIVQIISMTQNLMIIEQFNAEYKDATINESAQLSRLYINNAQDNHIEYLSLPLTNCIIRTTH